MKNKLAFLKTKQNALLLTSFATVCTLAVSLTHMWTAPLIEQQKQIAVLNSLNELLDPAKFDNNPLLNCTKLSVPKITGSDLPQTFYRATLNGQPYATVFQTRTEQGYNGLIELLVAIDNNGVVQGTRTLTHQETPGLGDKIELAKSDWILSFNQKSVRSEDDDKWNVKKDGGRFDQFTGATITPRAIVKQLRQSVFQAQQNFDNIFASPNDCLASSNKQNQSLTAKENSDE